MSPNWFLNIASPILHIPIWHFFLSVFVGLMPYNFICVQTGSVLSELQSLDGVFSVRTLATLFTIALTFSVPLLIRRFLQRGQSAIDDDGAQQQKQTVAGSN